jgi:SSS family solute:Na+ symporter
MIAFAMSEKGLIQMESSDAAFPTLVATLLPAGVKGIVVGGLVAALMSSLASLFNSSATLFTVDFYKKYKPGSSEKHLVKVGRIATAVVVVLGIVWIPVMRLIADVLYEYLQKVQSLVAPGIAAVFFLGIFSKRITSEGGLTGMITGFVLGMFRLVLEIFSEQLMPGSFLYELMAINWLHYSVFLCILVIIVIIVVSLLTKRPDKEKIKGLTYGSVVPEQKAENRASWNKWDVIHTAIVAGIVIAFYIYFF